MTILTKKETAAQLKISLNSLTTLITTGKIAYVKLTARRIGIAQSDIDAYINAQRVGGLGDATTA